jgi:hypothetical protein
MTSLPPLAAASALGVRPSLSNKGLVGLLAAPAEVVFDGMCPGEAATQVVRIINKSARSVRAFVTLSPGSAVLPGNGSIPSSLTAAAQGCFSYFLESQGPLRPGGEQEVQVTFRCPDAAPVTASRPSSARGTGGEGGGSGAEGEAPHLDSSGFPAQHATSMLLPRGPAVAAPADTQGASAGAPLTLGTLFALGGLQLRATLQVRYAELTGPAGSSSMGVTSTFTVPLRAAALPARLVLYPPFLNGGGASVLGGASGAQSAAKLPGGPRRSDVAGLAAAGPTGIGLGGAPPPPTRASAPPAAPPAKADATLSSRGGSGSGRGPRAALAAAAAQHTQAPVLDFGAVPLLQPARFPIALGNPGGCPLQVTLTVSAPEHAEGAGSGHHSSSGAAPSLAAITAGATVDVEFGLLASRRPPVPLPPTRLGAPASSAAAAGGGGIDLSAGPSQASMASLGLLQLQRTDTGLGAAPHGLGSVDSLSPRSVSPTHSLLFGAPSPSRSPLPSSFGVAAAPPEYAGPGETEGGVSSGVGIRRGSGAAGGRSPRFALGTADESVELPAGAPDAAAAAPLHPDGPPQRLLRRRRGSAVSVPAEPTADTALPAGFARHMTLIVPPRSRRVVHLVYRPAAVRSARGLLRVSARPLLLQEEEAGQDRLAAAGVRVPGVMDAGVAGGGGFDEHKDAAGAFGDDTEGDGGSGGGSGGGGQGSPRASGGVQEGRLLRESLIELAGSCRPGGLRQVLTGHAAAAAATAAGGGGRRSSSPPASQHASLLLPGGAGSAASAAAGSTAEAGGLAGTTTSPLGYSRALYRESARPRPLARCRSRPARAGCSVGQIQGTAGAAHGCSAAGAADGGTGGRD